MLILWLSVLAVVIGLGFAGFLVYRLAQTKVEDQKAAIVASYISAGAKSFWLKEYKLLAVLVILIAVIIFAMPVLTWRLGAAFLFGAVVSALVGWIGMKIATLANVRAAESFRRDAESGFKVSFLSGAVTSLAVVCLGWLGVAISYLVFGDPQIIFGFCLGASLVALLARVGGGIYTKAADVGADLAGKMEAGIAEDDLRNPASIASSIGDNVGDIVGKSADLFESYCDSIVAAMVFGVVFLPFFGAKAIILPLIVAAVGIISSVVGASMIFFVKNQSPRRMMSRGVLVASLLTAVISFFAVKFTVNNSGIFWSLVFGLLASAVIGFIVEYYTSITKRPVQEIAKSAETGAATNIISGFSFGLSSVAWPAFVLAIAIALAYKSGDVYGVAMAAVGMLSTLGISLAIDSHGPVADNAASIIEMARLGDDARSRAEEFDTKGNTAATVGKGFAAGSAVLTAFALLIYFSQTIHLSDINLLDIKTLVGLIIGGVLPFVFSAWLIKAVGRAAGKIVNETRRQFREISGLMEGTVQPDYNRCIAISTGSALRQMIMPGLLAVLAPIVVGFWLGAESLAGLLAGSIIVGFLLAMFMNNAGGAWDNAKKYIEAGNFGGKGSDAHKAAVIGDTIGDPLKDTAGPALNILIKLMAIIAIIIAPLIIM